MSDLALGDIIIGGRGRGDLGDLRELAESIRTVGLLHPVVVTAEHELVAGVRRIEAVRLLGWQRVPVTVVDLDNAAEVLRAELEENTCRKSLSAYEADVIRQQREEILRPKARDRQAHGQTAPGKSKTDASAKLAEAKSVRETRKATAVDTGYSGSTLDKVRTIRDAAERGVVKRGKGEVPAPEPVREIAKQAVDNVKQTGAAIDREFQRVTQAVDTYVQTDPDVQQAKRMKAFDDAIKATRRFCEYDFSHLTGDCTDKDWESYDFSIAALERAIKSYRNARPRGLRAV